MPSEHDHITPDEFLGNSMRNECQAGFEEFLNLWQSSESLRLLIRQAVASDPSVSRDTSSSYKEEEIHPIITKAFSKQNKVIESLIAQGTLSPSMLTEKLSLSYGGLSRKELLVLLNKFKAGKRSLGTYMLVRAWKRHSSAKSCLADVRLKQLTLDCFSRAITENRSDFFNDIADTLRFLQNEEYQDEGQWNHDPGQWWQFNLLLYILEYPKEKYAMREFVSYFTDEVGSNEMPTTKTIRKFCRSQGIALDSSPGAPKKKKQSS